MGSLKTRRKIFRSATGLFGLLGNTYLLAFINLIRNGPEAFDFLTLIMNTIKKKKD